MVACTLDSDPLHQVRKAESESNGDYHCYRRESPESTKSVCKKRRKSLEHSEYHGMDPYVRANGAFVKTRENMTIFFTGLLGG
jgi:hypothetical protein